MTRSFDHVEPGRTRLRRAGVALLMACVSVSGCLGAPRYRGNSPNFDGLEFRNLAPYEERDLCDVIEWKLGDEAKAWPEWIETAPGPTPAERVEHGVVVTFVNHATTLIQVAGVNIVTDPVWSDFVGPSSLFGTQRRKRAGIRFEQLPPIDVVLLSHNHYDHLDVPTLQRLNERDSPLFIGGLGTVELLAESDIQRTVELDWWAVHTWRGVAITFAPAQHWSARGVEDWNVNLWGGFYLRTSGDSIYFAGDTGAGPHFEAIRQRLGAPDLALLPIGAYQPRWFMHPQHIDPREAVDAHLTLRAKRSLAIHWGTFDLSDEGHDEPVIELTKALAERELDSQSFVVLENGEKVTHPR